MFYTYALTADSAGANSYSKVLSAASPQSSVVTPRTAPLSRAFGCPTPQNAGVFPPDPFGPAFGPAFGTGAGGSGNYILLTVNLIRKASESNLAAMTRLGFTGKTKSVGVGSAQSAAATSKHLAQLLLGLVSGQAWGLSFPRLGHVISSVASPDVARQGRGYGRAFGVNTPSNPFTSEFTSEWGVGPGGYITNLQMTTNLSRGAGSSSVGHVARIIGKAALSAHDASIVGLRIPGRICLAVSAAVQSHILKPGKVAAASSAEAVAIRRGSPLRNATASTQSSHLGFGNLYFRGASVATTQALLVLRGMSAARGTVSSSLASLIRTPARILKVASAESVALVKTTARLLGALSPSAAAVIRLTGTIRQAFSTSLAAVAETSARFRSLGAVDAQVAAALTTHVRPLLAAVASAQQAALTRLNTLSHLLPLGVASAQATRVVRGISHAGAAVSASASNSLRSVGRLLGAISSEVAALVAIGLHFVVVHVGSAQTALERGSQILLRGVASAQVVHGIAGKRTVTAALAAFSASATAVRRTVVKLLSTVSTQAAVAGRINFKIIGAVTANVAARLVPRGLLLGAAQSQRGRVVSWFHLFVPDWAYQQTTLLPPGGGPAEPPSFGPIDPADQTTFAFDWSKRANFNDPIVSAKVVSIPPGMSFLGPVFTGGTLVEVTALPLYSGQFDQEFTPEFGGASLPFPLPTTVLLRCTCVFASGRRSSFSIPVPIRNL